MTKEIWVKKHRRSKPSGGTTEVRRHKRQVQGTPAVISSSGLSVTEERHLQDCIAELVAEGTDRKTAEGHCLDGLDQYIAERQTGTTKVHDQRVERAKAIERIRKHPYLWKGHKAFVEEYVDDLVFGYGVLEKDISWHNRQVAMHMVDEGYLTAWGRSIHADPPGDGLRFTGTEKLIEGTT